MKRIPVIIIISILFGASITYGAELILGSSVYYDNNESNLSSTTVQDAIDEIYEKCNVKYILTNNDFAYSGTEQIFSVPETGNYKIETWGAQGGHDGGYGGYSVGNIFLNAGDKLYVVIGESPTNSHGGYNGGGNGTENGSKNFYVTGGGGATHIALTSGLLSSLSDDISKILIVSGGGGGKSQNNSTEDVAGSGGGYIGNFATAGYYGRGGTQTAGGLKANGASFDNGASFGQGSNATKLYETSGSRWYAGGGGGFYGGSGGGWSTTRTKSGSGGGGTGYIGNSNLTDKSMYCYNCTESSEESIKTISTTCSSETPIENCSKKGNGYARISLIK